MVVCHAPNFEESFRRRRADLDDKQRRIVAHLDGLQAKVNAMRELQSQSQEELDALLPSILDKAFKGEL